MLDHVTYHESSNCNIWEEKKFFIFTLFPLTAVHECEVFPSGPVQPKSSESVVNRGPYLPVMCDLDSLGGPIVQRPSLHQTRLTRTGVVQVRSSWQPMRRWRQSKAVRRRRSCNNLVGEVRACSNSSTTVDDAAHLSSTCHCLADITITVRQRHASHTPHIQYTICHDKFVFFPMSMLIFSFV